MTKLRPPAPLSAPRRIPGTVFIVALLLSGTDAAAAAACPPGEPVQWMADYCMARGETDDLEAVSPCINAASAKKFASGCAAKLHYKRLLCTALAAHAATQAHVEQCVADPDFAGPIVERNNEGR
jgi:hypothetical protein